MSTGKTMTKSSGGVPTTTLEALKKAEEKKIAARKKRYWQKGKSGNPSGRPKGAKGKVTLLREAVLNDAEEMVLSSWEDLVTTTITLANQGDTTCLKILWDRVIPSKRAVDINHNNNDKMNITINVSKLEVEEPFSEKEVIEAEIVEEDNSES